MMYERALQATRQVPGENRKYPIVDFELVKQCGTTVAAGQHPRTVILCKEAYCEKEVKWLTFVCHFIC